MEQCRNKDEHSKHLCKLTSEGTHKNNPTEYAGLVKDPKFVCKSCGRVAGGKEYLCDPVLLGTWEE